MLYGGAALASVVGGAIVVSDHADAGVMVCAALMILAWKLWLRRRAR